MNTINLWISAITRLYFPGSNAFRQFVLKKINLSRSKALEKLKESKTDWIKVNSYFDLLLKLYM